jgi:hypothetical protein
MKTHHKFSSRTRLGRLALTAAIGVSLIIGGTQPAVADVAQSDVSAQDIADLKAFAHADTQPIPAPSDNQRSAQRVTCPAPTHNGTSVCITASDVPATWHDGVTSRAIQPIPSWCASFYNGGRQVTRTQDCASFGLTVTKTVTTNNVPRVVGTAQVAAYSYQYTSYSTPVVAHQYGFSVSSVSGDVSGVILSATSNCSGSCVQSTAVIPGTPVAISGWKEAESFTQPTSTAVGSINYLATAWTFSVSVSGGTGGSASTGPYDLRCDNAAGGSSPTAGCAVYYAPGQVTYSSSSNPSLVSHLAQAIGSGLPGGSVYDPLHRTQVQSVINLNRSIACGGVPAQTGLSCDEYPFASSYEGAAAGGSARSFPGCGLSDPAGTGPVGYSRCMVVAGQNSSAGAILGNTYRQQRILDGDPFIVALS